MYHVIIITFFIQHQLYDTYKSFDNGAIKTSILHWKARLKMHG